MRPKTELEDSRCCWLMFCFWSLVALRDEMKGATKIKKNDFHPSSGSGWKQAVLPVRTLIVFQPADCVYPARGFSYGWLDRLDCTNKTSHCFLLDDCWEVAGICTTFAHFYRWEFQRWKWQDLLLKFPLKLRVDSQHLDGRQSDVSPPSPQPFIKVSPVITMATSVTRETPVADLGATINFPQDLQLPKTHARQATAIRGLGCDAGVCSDRQVQTGQ